jgi:predicted AlkP superfamily phosphohydrolase/phosphomutase
MPSKARSQGAETLLPTLNRRLLIIGLDCAAPELIFDEWRAELPTLSRLMEQGIYARMESCVPAITVPAWACMMSSRDPGQLGIYGFRNRADHSYNNMITASARSLDVPRLWDLLGDAGKRVGVIGVPQTYPVSPVNGELVSCFLTPSARSQYTHPPMLKDEIAGWIEGEFLVDVPNFRSEDKAGILRDIYRMANQHFEVCERLLARARYDFFMTVDMGVDRIHHGFWKDMDLRHPRYQPGSPFANAIREYYHYIDGQVARLLKQVDDDTLVLVVSDHGGKVMLGGVCLNEWLIKEGYLVLHEYPSEPVPLERCQVDWSRTRAWGSGGYYGRLFLNVHGREPNGVIPAADYEKVRGEIAAKLAALPDHQGRPLNTRAFQPDAIYRESRGVPPDLLIYFGDLDWRSVGSVGKRELYTFENDTGPDDANHAQYGTFIFYDPRNPGGGRRVDDISIYDIAPTLLDRLGQPIPAGMIGKVLAL